MKTATDALLVVAVAAAWLGCLGFVRLRTDLDRLHCIAFVNATTGAAILLAALLADGLSDRVLKILLILGLNLLTGAASAHLIGRAIVKRHAA